MNELEALLKKVFYPNSVKKLTPLTKSQIKSLAYLQSLKDMGFTNKQIVDMMKKRGDL